MARSTRAIRHARAVSSSSVPRSGPLVLRSNPRPDRGSISSISRTEDRTEEDRSGPVRAGPRSGPVSDRKLHSPKVDYFEFLEYSKKKLTQGLIKCIRCEQDYLSKIKFLKKTISNLTFEKECLEKSKFKLTLELRLLE